MVDEKRRRPLPRRVAVAAVIAAAALAAYGWDRLAEAREQTARNRLRAVGTALHLYLEAHDRTFPPALVEGPDGRPWHSWRMLIRPYVEGVGPIAYRFDEPWDSPHNAAAAVAADNPFQSGLVGGTGEADVLAVVGRRTGLAGPHALHLDDAARTWSTFALAGVRAVPWTKPEDLSVPEAIEVVLAAEEPPYHIGGDGTASRRRIGGRELAVQAFLTRRRAVPLDQWPAYLRTGREGVEPPELATGPAFDITPVRDAVPRPGQTFVWCSTFASAWNAAREEVGGPLEVVGAATLCDALNSQRPPDLGDSAAVSIARGEMSLTVRATLAASLPFENAFSVLDEPIRFAGGPPVVAVGRRSENGDSKPTLQTQVEVLRYVDPGTHTVRLNTTSPTGDYLILHQTPDPPAEDATLADLWAGAAEKIRVPRANGTGPHLADYDTLAFPRIAFDARRSFERLDGGRVMAPAAVRDWRIEEASQRVRFQLDERGADLYSDAVLRMIGSIGDEPPAPGPRRFVYDRPFLLAAVRPDAGPYLLIWFGSAAAMTPAGSPGS